MAHKKPVTNPVKSTPSQAAVDRKRSLAAKKGAVTRALNRETAAKRTLRLRHKLVAGGMIAVVIAFTVFGICDQLGVYAASSRTGSIVGLGGKCLDNYAGKHVRRNQIQIYNCKNNEAQIWTISSGGSIKVANARSYCLDIPRNSKNENTYVQLWTCSNSAAQNFRVSGTTIVSKTTGFCMTVKDGKTANETRVWMKKCNGSQAQKWTVKTTAASSGSSSSSSSSSANGSGSAGSTGSSSSSGSASAGGTSVGSNGVKYGTPEHPFAARSPWNTPIPANPAIDPNSNGINNAVINNRSLVLNMILYAYGQPVYTSTNSTPYITLGGRVTHWTMPMDPAWRQNDGADGKLDVFDVKTGYSYELQAYNPGDRTAYWGVKHNYVTGLADGYPDNGELRGPTGSGMSQLAGMIRISDIRSGSIEHALSFITSDPQAGAYRYPASGTDGKRNAPNGIAEGMRLQLDPSLNVDAIPGIGAGEKMVAKALQKYGAYCTDTGGGNNMAAGFYAEKPTNAGDPYPGAGWNQDWAQLSHIPRDRIRVVAESVTRRP